MFYKIQINNLFQCFVIFIEAAALSLLSKQQFYGFH